MIFFGKDLARLSVKLSKIYFLLCIIASNMIVDNSKIFAQNIQIPQLPGLSKTSEHRQVVNVTNEPWQIIGRVQTDSGIKCTGFLISPRIVVTAAHCLWIKKTKQFFAPQSIHFLLGYQRQQYKIASPVMRIFSSDFYRDFILSKTNHLTPNKPLDDIVFDRIYLVLPKDILPASELIPLSTKLPTQNTPVWLGGYEQDRKEVLYADKKCVILKRVDYSNMPSKIFYTCQATYGSSGAPLFVQDSNGKWTIIGIQVAAFVDKAGGIAGSLINK